MIRKILWAAGVTMGTMWVANQLAAVSPLARRVLKGNAVAAVNTGGTTTTGTMV